MRARELFKEGKLEQAIESLGADLRSDPADAQRRVFLFELLCFVGQYDRAEKQLEVLARDSQEAAMGTLLYRSAVHASRTRHDMFHTGDFPSTGTPPADVSGTLNGRRFASLRDADPRIGPRMEIYAAGQYTWLPFQHVASVRAEPPKRVRDLLWAPAIIKPGEAFRDLELGEVLLPALTPQATDHPDDAVRLGRVTAWERLDDDHVPVGQKLWLIDGEEFPILELRELEIDPSDSPN